MEVHIPQYMYTRGMKFEKRRDDEVFEFFNLNNRYLC